MKVNEITLVDVKSHLKIDINDEDNYLQQLILVAESYIKSYTGLDDIKINEIEELGHVALMIIADLYENRTISVDEKGVHKIYDSMINMYAINLL